MSTSLSQAPCRQACQSLEKVTEAVSAQGAPSRRTRPASQIYVSVLTCTDTAGQHKEGTNGRRQNDSQYEFDDI